VISCCWIKPDSAAFFAPSTLFFERKIYSIYPEIWRHFQQIMTIRTAQASKQASKG